jgi:hypothetical protein
MACADMRRGVFAVATLKEFPVKPDAGSHRCPIGNPAQKLFQSSEQYVHFFTQGCQSSTLGWN